jgi:hypothetical protein
MGVVMGPLFGDHPHLVNIHFVEARLVSAAF